MDIQAAIPSHWFSLIWYKFFPPRKESRRTQAGYPPTTPSPPWRTSSKVHQRRSSQRFEIRLMGNMFVVSMNDGTVKTPKKKAIWIVDFQWIGRKAVNVSIVSIDNQRNHCLANLILNGQVQRENCPFLLHKSTLPFRVEGMKGWKSWTVLENHLAMATKRPAELTMFDYHPFSQLFSEFVWSGKWFDSTIYGNTVRWFGSSTRGGRNTMTTVCLSKGSLKPLWCHRCLTSIDFCGHQRLSMAARSQECMELHIYVS